MAVAYAQYILCNNACSENTTGSESCNVKFANLSHPDLHFVFPVATVGSVKKHPVSSYFLSEWRNFFLEHPYGSLFDWYKFLGVDNKQGQINVHEAADINKALSLKSFEGGYKVMIIWMADKLNTQAANKLLKLIEEPPSKTLFILISDDEEHIINTIRSRCQVIHFPPLSENDITKGLIRQYNISDQEASKVSRQAEGCYNRAIEILNKDSDDDQFEMWFIDWVRNAFKAKGNKAAILELMAWAEDISKTGRETQKLFLHFCIDFFRQALMFNYGAHDLVLVETKSSGFKLANFAPYVHNNNILDIYEALQDAIYHIERNGNAKIILTDLSIKLTRLLHAKLL
jgi:DNA polymerase-3 subunit delta'